MIQLTCKTQDDNGLAIETTEKFADFAELTQDLDDSPSAAADARRTSAAVPEPLQTYRLG
jgi:hypothetical protein